MDLRQRCQRLRFHRQRREVSLTDTLAGLDTLTFPDITGPGTTIPLNGVSSSQQTHPYDFDAADNVNGTWAVTSTDRAGNFSAALVEVLNDTLAPTVAVTVPTSAGLTFAVTWGGADAASGLRHFEVQYRLDGGAWTDWLTGTTTTAATFVGQADTSHTFRVQAADNVGNVSAWQESPAVTIDAVTKYYHHGSSRVAMWQGGEVYYLHGDHLGSTSLTTDDQGSVVHEARYLPFGEERWVDGEEVTDFTFTGQRRETSFDLHDYNARFYSSYLNRFVSPDTIIPDYANPQSLNRYAYTLNNPVKLVDPTGHADECGLASGGGGCGCPNCGEVYRYIANAEQNKQTPNIAPDLYIEGVSGRLGPGKAGAERVYDFSTNEFGIFTYGGYYAGTDVFGADAGGYVGLGRKGSVREKSLKEAYSDAFYTFGGGKNLPFSLISLGIDYSVSGAERFDFTANTFPPPKFDAVNTLTVGAGVGGSTWPFPVNGHAAITNYDQQDQLSVNLKSDIEMIGFIWANEWRTPKKALLLTSYTLLNNGR